MPAVLVSVFIAAMLLSGCVTKAKARVDAQKAFLAGQQEALARIQRSQPHGPNITLIGPVRNPTVTWNPDLTLARALVEAEYYGAADPSEIYIVRNGVAFRVDPRQLLSGQDVPLKPGDLVQIGRPGSSPAPNPAQTGGSQQP